MFCKNEIADLFESLGVNFRSHDLDQMFYIMDYNDTGIIERTEFVQGVVELCEQIRPMSIMELHYQVSKCTSKVAESDACVERRVGELSQTMDQMMSHLCELTSQRSSPTSPQVEGPSSTAIDVKRFLLQTLVQSRLLQNTVCDPE